MSLEALEALGFGRTEAQVYAALVRHGTMNGYQVAKLLGISRPSAYDCLASLVARGCVTVVEGDSKLYCAEDPSELFPRLKKAFARSADEALNFLNEVSDRSGDRVFLTLAGTERVSEQVGNLVANARRSLLISGDYNLRPLAPDLEAAVGRGVRITVFSFLDPGLDELPVEVHSYRNPDDPGCLDRRILMVADGEQSLIASLDGPHGWSGTVTRHRLLAKVVAEHIGHDIRLYALAGPRPELP